MFRSSITLFHVRGVPVKAHWTLLLIMPYLAFVFSIRFREVAHISGVEPGAIVLPPIVWGLLISVGLFASVAFHELAHTLLTIHFGGRVREITLMLLGGVSQVEHMPREPGREGLIAAVGPLSSLVLAGLLFLVLLAPLPADVHLGVYYLAQLNLTLGFFNLLPAFPLDGGRVLRSLLATRFGPERATRIAAGVGKVGAAVMAALALWTGAFMLLLIAFFLYSGADAEARYQTVRDNLASLRVADLMVRNMATVTTDATLAEALRHMRDASRLDLVVTTPEGAPAGMLRAADIAEVHADLREVMRVSDLVPRIASRAVTASPGEPAADALERAAAAGVEYLFAVENGRLVGVLGKSDLEKVLALRSLEERRPSAPRRTPRPWTA